MKNFRMLTSMQWIWRNVTGFLGRKNSVCVTTPQCIDSSATSHDHGGVVVFFPGDVQTFRDGMSSNNQRRRFQQWNLEQCGFMLQSKFPTRLIIVVEPCRFGAQTFACFDNFVATTHDLGIPLFNPNDVTGWQHLHALLEAISSKIADACDLNDNEDSANFMWKGDISLIGFSKGACVLNQLLLSIPEARRLLSPPEQATRRRVKNLYYLDAGHNGSRNIYLTEPAVIDNLNGVDDEEKIGIHLHVTPYQMTDVNRPWIADEATKFAALCAERKVLVRALYHIAEPAKLDEKFVPAGCKPPEIVYDLLARDRFCFYESSCLVSRSIDFHFKVIEKFLP